MRIRGDWILVTLLLVAGQRLVGNTEIYAPVNGELIDSLNTTTASARTISIQSPNGFELVLSPDGSTFYVLFVNYWNTILAVNSSTGAVKQQYHTTYQRWDNFLSSIPFYVSADESRFVVGTCADNVEGTCQAGFAEVFDVAGGEEVGMISLGGDEVSGVALSADGSTGYAGHFYNFVCVGCGGARPTQVKLEKAVSPCR